MRIFVIAAPLFLMAAGPGIAQPADAPLPGYALAEDLCGECHAIDVGDFVSPDPGAPPFQAIADKPEMSELALTVFFQTPHPSMPNLIVTGDDARDLIDYMQSLK
jgi:mono/diheme cytochrome c family protein